MAAVQAPLRGAAMTPRRAALPHDAMPGPVRAAAQAAGLVVLVQTGVVLLALMRALAAPGDLAAALSSSWRELLFSVALAVAAAGLSLLLSLPVARLLAKGSAGLWAAVLLPVALPAPLVGAGLVSLWNRPQTGQLYTSALMPLLAALARFLPLAAMVMAAFLRRADPLLTDAARVFGRNRLRALVRAWMPLFAPALLASAGIVFALTLGEIGATLVVAPPGRATLSMKIYNYLHYGASGMVASLCLLSTAVTALGGWAVFKAARA
jgi:iron(III) transport system permease protein